MRKQANCKINLGLNIVRRRPDGYHDLQTIFLPISLCDELTITPDSHFSFHQDGIAIDSSPDDNLCSRAFRLLQQHYESVQPVSIHLSKHIPFGAGLGGGSSDAATTLVMLSQLFNLNLDTTDLFSLAAKLGADCPFFIYNQPAIASGIGDQLAPVQLPQLSGLHLVLLKPPVAISTAEAYRGVKPAPWATPLLQAIAMPVSEWRNYIFNDFEQSLFPRYPELSELKSLLYNQGALYASMTGSGSALYGLFSTPPASPLPHEVWRQLL